MKFCTQCKINMHACWKKVMRYYLVKRQIKPSPPPLVINFLCTTKTIQSLSFQFQAGQWNVYVLPHTFVAFDPPFLKRYADYHYIDRFLVYLSGVLDHFLNPGLPTFLIFFDNRFQYFQMFSNRISDIF